MEINELKDTISLMQSEDFRERFLAEYYQLKIRRDKLSSMLFKLERGQLNFVPSCPKVLLEEQLKTMNKMMGLLEARAVIENIKLD